jgi:hypothetical protein
MPVYYQETARRRNSTFCKACEEGTREVNDRRGWVWRSGRQKGNLLKTTGARAAATHRRDPQPEPPELIHNVGIKTGSYWPVKSHWGKRREKASARGVISSNAICGPGRQKFATAASLAIGPDPTDFPDASRLMGSNPAAGDRGNVKVMADVIDELRL